MASNVCFPMSKDTNLLLNSFIHILVLFGFLTAFFMFFVSKIETEVLNEQLKSVIESQLKSNLKKGDTDQNLKRMLNTPELQEVLKKLTKEYSTPDKTTTEWNKWLFKLSVTIVVALLVLVLTMWLTLSLSCDRCVNGAHIFWENLVIFGCIGFVEYLFFTKIAIKFIPAPPSYLSAQFFDSIKKDLG